MQKVVAKLQKAVRSMGVLDFCEEATDSYTMRVQGAGGSGKDCDEDAAQCILQTLMEKTDEELNHPFTRIFALGLGLLFLGQ